MPAPSPAHLYPVSGLPFSASVVVAESPFVVGRKPTCQLVVNSGKISRQHAELVFQHGYWWLSDLHSRNGVWLNETRLSPQTLHRLRHGDLIRLGKTMVLRFEEADTTLSEETLTDETAVTGLRFDPQQGEFVLAGRVLKLSSGEFRLLKTLYLAQGRVMSNDDIVAALWPEARGGITDQTIDTAVKRLREALARWDDHEYIVTVRGRGRKFVPKPTD